jgi:hypothetical protein
MRCVAMPVLQLFAFVQRAQQGIARRRVLLDLGDEVHQFLQHAVAIAPGERELDRGGREQFMQPERIRHGAMLGAGRWR